MLERIIFRDELNSSFLRLFFEFFLVFILLSLINVLLGGNYVFLVALCAISIAYPVVKFIRRQDHRELSEKSLKNVSDYFSRQVFVSWLIFLSATLAFLIMFGLLKDVSFHAGVVSVITGHLTSSSLGFSDILFNNLFVGFLTFLIAFISTAGIVFVLVWNASVLAYVLAKASSFFESFGLMFTYLGHGLLEVAGYVFVGLAASLLSYRLERYKRFDKSANKALFKQFFLLLFLGFLFIIIGAFIEIL